MNIDKNTELKNSFPLVWSVLIVLLAAFDSTRALKPFLLSAGAVLASAVLALVLIKLLKKQIPEEIRMSAAILSGAGFLAIAAVLLGAFFPGGYTASVKTVAAAAVLVCAECGNVLIKRTSPRRNGFTAGAALLGAKLVIAVVAAAVLCKGAGTLLPGGAIMLLAAAAAGLIGAWLCGKIFGSEEALVTLCTPVLMMAVCSVYAELPFSGFVFAAEATAVLCLAGILIVCAVFRRCDEADIPKPFHGAAAAIAAGIAAMACAAFM